MSTKHKFYTQLTPREMELLSIYEKSIKDIDLNLLQLKTGEQSVEQMVTAALLEIKIMVPQLRKLRAEVYKSKNSVTLKRMHL